MPEHEALGNRFVSAKVESVKLDLAPTMEEGKLTQIRNIELQVCSTRRDWR